MVSTFQGEKFTSISSGVYNNLQKLLFCIAMLKSLFITDLSAKKLPLVMLNIFMYCTPPQFLSCKVVSMYFQSEWKKV